MTRHSIRARAASLAAALALVLSCLPARAAQQQVGIPFKVKDAFVLQFGAPYERLLIDPGENNFTTADEAEVEIDAATQFLNKKDAPLDRALLRPGMRIEVAGERLGARLVARSVKVKINVEAWEVEVKGYFEKLDGAVARVDGQSVALDEGALILGDNEWRGKTFRSFGEMQLGSHVEVKGVRRADGVVHVRAGKTKPNLFGDSEKKMLAAVQQGLVLPQPGQLAGGSVKIADKQFKLVESLDIQSYVTQVGYKLLPRYLKDMPKDDPGRITYRFYVIEDESFNAFSLPDGSVFVHTGLLKVLKNEAQLAAVLGHEIAHVTHEHSRRRMETEQKLMWLALAAGVAGAATDKGYIALFGAFGAGVLSNKFGRDLEDQADRVGLFYMYEAGYDPREAPKVWREVAKVSNESSVSNFLYSDHSSARARLRNLNREIAYNYHGTDFAMTATAEDKYRSTLGPYFGWMPKPATPTSSAPAGANALTGSPSTPAKPQTPAATKQQQPARRPAPRGNRRP